MGYSFTFKFSEKDIDFSPSSGHFFNYHKLLINEFFNSTDEEMDTIMRAYQKRFGDSAFKYVMKTYYWGWRQGDKTITNVQQDRILAIMPDLLNEKANNRLNTIKEEAKYKLGIEEVINGIKLTVECYFRSQYSRHIKYNFETVEEIEFFLLKEFNRANNLNLHGSFFVLNSSEKNELLQISKYIVYTKLKNQFDQIKKDFNAFVPFMQLANKGIFSATYDITSFNITIDLTKTVFHEIKTPEILVDEILANSRFKEFSDKYLANELVTINSDANKSISGTYLNTHDIKLFFDHYEDFSNSDSEVNMKSSFRGEIGNLNIQIHMKPIKMLKTSIAKAISKITIYTIIAVGILSVAIRNEWFPILFIGGFFVAVLYFKSLSKEIKLIKHLKTEIKQYGQQ